jgi:hypothetical protein
MKRICRFALGLTIATAITACQDDKPASPGSQDAAAGKDAAKDTTDVGSQPGLDSKASNDSGGLDGISQPLDASTDRGTAMDGGVATDGRDAPAVDANTDIALGDASLEVGYGSEVQLDGAPMCDESSIQACASPGNPLIGACHAGTRVCAGGVWGPCSEVLPAPSEACNGLDDNCNGMVDEGCAAECTVVCANCAGSADGGAANGSVEHPFASIEAALAAAGPIDGGSRKRICVVGGATCRESTVYPSDNPLKVPDGLILQGAYAITEAGLVYCPGANIRPRTTLTFASNEGVVFDQTVVTGAEVSSLVIEINPPQGTGPAATTAAAIAIKGAKNVSLSRVFVTESFAAANTYGVAITSGGQATIAGSAISTGQGRSSAVGVYVNGGSVNLRNNCDNIVGGNCESNCGDGGSMLGVHGYVPASPTDAPLQSSGVFITGTASSLVGNMICGGSSQNVDGQSVSAVGALRCEGTGCTTVSGNVIVGGNDRDAVAVALVGAAPLLDGNRIEGGCGSRSTTGVWLESASARLQNNRILGGQCPGDSAAVFSGLHLVSGGTSAGPDVHSNDIEPLGLSSDCQSIGVLVERASGAANASAGVLRNNIISAGICNRRFAISEGAGATLQSLHNNDLYAPAGGTPTSSLVLYHSGSTDATTAAQVNAIALAGGNISSDPQYAAYPNDLHLTAQSPCIDQGTSASAPASDVDGHARPAGVGYDIGAYEFTR